MDLHSLPFHMLRDLLPPTIPTNPAGPILILCQYHTSWELECSNLCNLYIELHLYDNIFYFFQGDLLLSRIPIHIQQKLNQLILVEHQTNLKELLNPTHNSGVTLVLHLPLALAPQKLPFKNK